MRLCVLYGIVLLCFKLNAQSISNVDFKAINNNIEITYDYIKPDDKQYTIEVYLISEKNQKEIKAQYLSGDINPKENGYGKKITWQVINQKLNINDKCKIQLILVSQDFSVTIGNQVWMIKNLDVATFRNGDLIPQAKTAKEWRKANENQQPAWCYYNNDPYNGTKYGKLYNWYAVIDARGLAPKGYHIPTDAEWTTLTDYLGGEKVAGTKMKSNSDWNQNGNVTNSSGFNGLLGRGRSSGGAFANIGDNGYYWSSTEDRTDDAAISDAWGRHLNYGDGTVGRNDYDKGSGFYVRCLRD